MTWLTWKLRELWWSWCDSYPETKFFFLGCAFVIITCASLCAGALPARADHMTNLSWCADRSLESNRPGPCPWPFDFGNEPRQLRYGDELRCPSGAWGYKTPVDGEPIHDRLVTVDEFRRLCPGRAFVAEPHGPDVPAPPVLLEVSQ